SYAQQVTAIDIQEGTTQHIALSGSALPHIPDYLVRPATQLWVIVQGAVCVVPNRDFNRTINHDCSGSAAPVHVSENLMAVLKRQDVSSIWWLEEQEKPEQGVDQRIVVYEKPASTNDRICIIRRITLDLRRSGDELIVLGKQISRRFALRSCTNASEMDF